MNNQPQPAQDAPRPTISLKGVTKRFPGVVANDQIDLDIMPGEVHVLLGENGAGKSTLIGLLSGLQHPDEGEILIDGAVTRITSPQHALSLGIGTVFQHAMLVPTLTVTENLMLGEPWWKRPNKEFVREKVAEIAASLGMQVSLDALASDLSLGEQQFVEILRALFRESRVLILDESTSMLTPKGAAELGALMRRLVERGLAVIFITHKLREGAIFGDTISVLKLGKKVGEISSERFKQLNEQELVAEIVETMFGKTHGEIENQTRTLSEFSDDAPEVLSVANLNLEPGAASFGLDNISFSLRAGEILGIAGIDGNGQQQLAEVLAGQLECPGGQILLQGNSIAKDSVGLRRAKGLRYLTDDRLGEGTVGDFSVAINLLLKQVGEEPFWKRGIVQNKAILQNAREMVEVFDVRTPSINTPVGRLSGGNIQKLIVARELVEGAKAVIFSKPTYGLDLANTLSIQQRISEIADDGKGVILISTELDELLALANRIAVMAEGRMVGIVDNSDTARTEIGRLMIGVTE